MKEGFSKMATHELIVGQRLELLRRAWGWIALRGVFAVLFGVLALVMPGITLAVMIIFWGAYALIDGVVALVAGFRMRENGKPLWSLVFIGLLGIAAGVVTFLWPGLTALTLVFIIGIWAIAVGIFQIVAAVRFRKVIQGEWLHALSGVLSVVFGIAILLQPGAGAMALTWIIGGFAIAFGVLLILMALRLRSVHQS
jgi:uncharacterized membrane protein HdeD (DUF308 family)